MGTSITFGSFRTLHIGDLTTDKEFELACPANRIGTIDVLLGLHHGQDTSNSVPFVHALRPRAAIMNNGTRKGGIPVVMRTLYSSPGFEDLWQIHFSLLSGQEYTVPGLFIANGVDDQAATMPIAPMPLPPPGPNTPPPPAHNGTAYWIKLSAQADGAFTITNARNGFSKGYRRCLLRRRRRFGQGEHVDAVRIVGPRLFRRQFDRNLRRPASSARPYGDRQILFPPHGVRNREALH